MTDTFLFLHLLSAAALFAGLVALSAVVLGAQLGSGATRAFLALWQGGLAGVIILGVVLAIDIDGYELWDAWIVIAIVLWLAAGGVGDRVSAAFRDAGSARVTITPRVAGAHWIHVGLVVLLLADMIWKPWA